MQLNQLETEFLVRENGYKDYSSYIREMVEKITIKFE